LSSSHSPATSKFKTNSSRDESGGDTNHSKKIADTTNKVSNDKSTKRQRDLALIKVGTRLSVFWPDDKEYYPAKVTSIKRDSESIVTTLFYDDGEVETVDLVGEKFKFLDDTVSKKTKVDNKEDLDEESSVVNCTAIGSKKKRHILEDSEEEFESDENDGEESDASEFIAPEESDDNDDEDELTTMITDEEDQDEDAKSSKLGRKRLCVTMVGNSAKKRKSSGSQIVAKSPEDERSKKSPSNTQDIDTKNRFASFITPPPKGKLPGTQFKRFDDDSPKKTIPVPRSDDNFPHSCRKITPSPSFKLDSIEVTKAVQDKKIPLPLPGVVNTAGTHYHNHFSFLLPSKRRDLHNRAMTDDKYNPRTLRVDYGEIERVTKSKITPASRQWWEIKSQYADTLLLFKTGKFYEIFHMDADIAVQILGFQYMKGQQAHAGFPEVGYGSFCERLVNAGHKVARVEQTETPDMLKIRKKNTKSGKKPQVVNREVCSIVSSGCRTFCYLDNVKSLENTTFHDSNGVGPLLAIKEILIENNNTGGENCDSLEAVCEFGVAMVDAVRGVVTLGQFADDVLRNRLNTLLTTFRPSEVLVQSGENAASECLISLLKGMQTTSASNMRVEHVSTFETFPKSTAIDPEVRRKMERPKTNIQPWDVKETVAELHRKAYFPRSSRKNININDSSSDAGTKRWPEVLKACISGRADLAISAFGAIVFYLQRSLIDEEILSMGLVKAYFPQESVNIDENDLKCIASKQMRDECDMDISSDNKIKKDASTDSHDNFPSSQQVSAAQNEDDAAIEDQIDHLALDGITLCNLEVLANSHSNTTSGSLWAKINNTKTPHGSRLLRAWLLRPLFRKTDIDRRGDAVEELISGKLAVALSEARGALSKCGDIERLLSRVHSMGGNFNSSDNGIHPNERAVLYETATYTRRKVGDFSKLLNGLRSAAQVPDFFSDINVKSGMLRKIVCRKENGGCFPSNLNQQLDWFFDNFDCNLAAKGLFEPARGIDEDYDAACDLVEEIKMQLDNYKEEMCSNFLNPSHSAKAHWKYANIKEESKDKYLIELPVNVRVPSDFLVKGKRGSGPKQINKYRTPVVEELVKKLEQAYDVIKAGKARGMQLVFAKFDSMRPLWSSAAKATSMLDALGSLAITSSNAGYTRPKILDCPIGSAPTIKIEQGRHPCVDSTLTGGDFIPNDLSLGGNLGIGDCSRVLLLSGPNMGGKSTLLRQTCLLTILAQVGCYVPAKECSITPVDRIFTRLGASDRILLGQSTFFVELAETAVALRGATRRSLVIMDELGRGTSTFDGTAIASAVVKHLVERNMCLTLFATHYHSLLEEWRHENSVRLGHMECLVEGDDDGDKVVNEHKVTFLYTLADGPCPKSFGINVAHLAALPTEVLSKAKQFSSSFEAEMSHTILGTPSDNIPLKSKIEKAVKEEIWKDVEKYWLELQLS